MAMAIAVARRVVGYPYLFSNSVMMKGIPTPETPDALQRSP